MNEQHVVSRDATLGRSAAILSGPDRVPSHSSKTTINTGPPIPTWEQPTDPTFVAMRLEPWRLRVFPGSLLMSGTGDLLTWHAA